MERLFTVLLACRIVFHQEAEFFNNLPASVLCVAAAAVTQRLHYQRNQVPTLQQDIKAQTPALMFKCGSLQWCSLTKEHLNPLLSVLRLREAAIHYFKRG